MSVEIGTKVEGESRICRSHLSPDKLIDSPEEVEKEITKIVVVEKKELKTWKYFQLSGYNWLTYNNNDIDQEIRTIGAGSFSQSMTIVTAYDTLEEEGLLHSMNEAEVNGMFANADLLLMVEKVAGRSPTLKFIIYNDFRLLTLKELKELGKDHSINPNSPQPQDICCIIYTSGFTGNPKGVMLTHANLVASNFHTKGWLMDKGLPTRPFDVLVFNKIKEQTDGRLRFVLSPISKETQEFLYITLCPILQGYEQFTYGSVGTPAPCIEVKLVAVPDAGYKSTNTPNPQGEVWIQDGWLQTGDIGEWKPNGSLPIIDRKKNLVKLAHGEYIALEKLESVYKSTLFVFNICVCANSYQSRPVALIFPIVAQIRKLATEKNIVETDFEELCRNQEITN
ncbi:8050_t:CDS:2 [Entrophospora sp. SA101]|nr:8050_t:CDS:2 [Entrophospora sp. SA101]